MVRHVEPTFIERYDPPDILGKCQKLDSALHSLDQASIRVCINGNLYYLTVGHIQAVTHHPPNLRQLHGSSSHGFELFLYLCRVVDRDTRVDVGDNMLLKLCIIRFSIVILYSFFFEDFRLPPRLTQDMVDGVDFDTMF